VTLRTAVLLIAIAACGGRQREGAWRDDELGRSRVVGRERGTLADATARLAAAATPAELVGAAVDVAALGGDVAAQRDAVIAAIDELSEDELVAAYRDADPGKPPAGAIALRLALLAHHRGDQDLARARLADFERAPDPALAERARQLAAETAAADPKLVAVLLPLSGRFAPIGEELRAAIELAPRQGATLAFLDTTGDEAGAAAAVDRAAARGAVAILGPVGERESVAAARRAAELGIPIGLLAPADGADPEAGVFRLVGSPADEARAAARLAAAESFPTVAVLAPRDDVGAAMADAFADEAKALGLHVARAGDYDPTGSDLETDLKEFLDLVPARNPRLARHLRKKGKKGWQTFSPDVDFSLLYVPDGHDRAALVAAFLPYLGVELATGEIADPEALARKHGGRIPQVVQLLGSGGWNHPGLITRGGDPVEGAIFVDACAGLLDTAGVSGEIAARFRDATGREPSTAALEAHDAARLLLAARAGASATQDVDRREAVRLALTRGKLDDGACPASAISLVGELERDPVVFTVEGGERVVTEY
jgi:ABC-type branched-subunit amino acid transport system substrate-binding protein